MNLRQFATAMTIGLCAISVASFIAARAADASTPTSYVTANMAGAGGTTSKYSSSATVRVSMTGTIRYTVAAGNPSGIAVQEVCKEQFGWDDLDELVYDWTAYQVEAVSTGKVMGSCYQANAAFATGSWFWGDASDPLKSDGTSESRYVVCLKTHGYVYTTVCSTHITNKRVPDVRRLSR